MTHLSFRTITWLGLLLALFAPCSSPDVKAQSGREMISWKESLKQEAGWYESGEAVRIAHNVLLYQHENGGWPKNIDMASVLSDTEVSRIEDEKADADGELNRTTIDNGATEMQLRYLARVYTATGVERLSESFMRGVAYLLEAQYDNGGWPQYYPIREGYYEHITFNDGAMIQVMRLIRDIAQGQPPYNFVDLGMKERALAAIEKGLSIILKTQIEVEGKLTAWCAQYDRYDLRPAKARSYELPSLSGGESVGIVRYLMEIDDPTPEVILAIEQAVEWFQKVRLTQIRLVRKADPSLPKGYDLIVGLDPAGASPLWARFYEIGTNYPMFVGRDGVVQDALSEIEYERRVGYAWLGDWPRELIENSYPAWREKWVSE